MEKIFPSTGPPPFFPEVFQMRRSNMSSGFAALGQNVKTRRQAHAKVDEAIGQFTELYQAALLRWKMTPRQRRRMRWLEGARPIGPSPLLSDMVARRKSSRILISLMGHHWRHRPMHPERKYFLLTFIDDMGNTLDRQPEVNLGAIRRKTDKAIRRIGLHAVACTEVQPLMNYPGKGRGRTLMYHTHAIAWTTKRFDVAAAEGVINGSRSWTNSFGAKPFVITPMTDARGEIDFLSYYITKLPYDAKNRMPNKRKPGHFLLMQTTAGYRPELALRVFEGLSLFTIPDVTFGVGEGAYVASRWRSKLLEWHQVRAGEKHAGSVRFDVQRFWRRLRLCNGSDRFQPYRFLMASERPTSIHD